MKRAGEILSVFFDERLMKKAQGYSRLFNFWAEAARKNGITAAGDHSRIRELDRGILLVEADHPGWIQILQTKEHQILADFRRTFPDMDITGISLMLSRGGPGVDVEAEQPDAGAVPDTVSTAAEAEEPAADSGVADNRAAGEPVPHDQTENAGYDTIKDEDFKETLKRLEQSIAAREKSPGKNVEELDTSIRPFKIRE